MCFKCKNPYFGGLRNCEMNINDERVKFDPSELVCPNCCPLSFKNKCRIHGVEYIEYKCRFCCSIALWFCFGNSHFCEPCH